PLSLLDCLLLVPRDAGVAALFWAGFFGKTTSWRGRRIRVGPATVILSEGASFVDRFSGRLREIALSRAPL
ncbi:MAG: hypothetical protein ACRDSJ_22740, partial [Rubrobacteraceae bacterium]